jgi:hypothetical protein
VAFDEVAVIRVHDADEISQIGSSARLSAAPSLAAAAATSVTTFEISSDACSSRAGSMR